MMEQAGGEFRGHKMPVNAGNFNTEDELVCVSTLTIDGKGLTSPTAAEVLLLKLRIAKLEEDIKALKVIATLKD